MINTSRFNWKRGNLYFGTKDTGFSIAEVEDLNKVGLYWVYYPEGDKSNDYYNLTRAKNHCKTLAMRRLNITPPSELEGADMAPKSLAGEFKLQSGRVGPLA